MTVPNYGNNVKFRHYRPWTVIYAEKDALIILTKMARTLLKSKKCIISNVDYLPGSKKSNLNMTLINDSSFKYESD